MPHRKTWRLNSQLRLSAWTVFLLLAKGLHPEVWEGSSHEAIANAIRHTRLTPFRSSNLLLRELLSTPVDRSTTPLANDRAVALLRMGAIPEALATAHAAASPNAAVLDTITRAALLYGHGATACSHARLARDAVTIPGAAGVFCEAVHGSAAVASLRLELEQELGDIGPFEAGLLDAIIHPELKEFAPQPDSAAAPERYRGRLGRASGGTSSGGLPAGSAGATNLEVRRRDWHPTSGPLGGHGSPGSLGTA